MSSRAAVRSDLTRETAADSDPLPFVLAIGGPTGSGKTALAIELARALGGEIVNYDSVQIYRGFDIGSAKPSAAERAAVPHHLFDIVEADEEFNAADYVTAADAVCRQIAARGNLPILVGGTGFYLRGFLRGLPSMPGRNETLRERLRSIAARPEGSRHLHRLLRAADPASGSRISPADRQRVERALEVWLTTGRPISAWEAPRPDGVTRVPHLIYAIDIPRAELIERLERRTAAIYAAGLIEETRSLLSRYPPTARPFESIGYREALSHLRGESTLGEAIAETNRRTRAYAKRQLTWFRGERCRWLRGDQPTEKCVADIIRDLENRQIHVPIQS
jgi:tRNA dimethylallyltransferase